MRRLFVLLALFLSAATHAGWQKIAQLDGMPTCCFFINDYTGLAGSGDYNRDDIIKIWRTDDRGFTWLPCNVPVATGQVTSIFMVDGSIGYASIFSKFTSQYSLWKTTDGGYSWFDFTKGNDGFTTCVWKTSRALIKAKWDGAPNGSTPGGRSTNDGNTWTSYFYLGSNERSNGIFFTDDRNGVVTGGPDAGASWRTGDGGLNWLRGGPLPESWSAWGYAGSQVFFAAAELNRELFWTTDGGNTWRRRYNFGNILPNNISLTGHVSGKGNTMYIQTTGRGILRTSANDSGLTWREVGGPSNIADSRAFYVSGCAGEYVIAFDSNGSVWRTTDGGDGTLGKTSVLTINHINFPVITACATLGRFGMIAFGDCGEFRITSAAIENDASGVFTLLPKSLPDTLGTGEADTFYVNFDPRGNPGTYTAQIRIKGEIDKLGNITSIDSLIKIAASATAVVPRLTASLNTVSFRELSVCEPELDTMITLKNTGCDTLVITNGPTPVAAPFTVQALPSMLILPPDSSAAFIVSFKPLIAGAFNSSTRIQATSQGQQQEIEILLSGSGRFGEGILSIPRTTLSFSPVSICASDSATGFITNTGCDTLLLDEAALSGDADFLLGSALPVGTKLRPGDTIWFTIILQPKAKGSRAGALSFTLRNEHGSFPPQTGAVTFSANVLDGKKVLTQSTNAIDFGVTTLCEERDSVVVLYNKGCDTIIVTDARLIGNGYRITSGLPIIIAPGDSGEITITTELDTTGGTPQSLATLMVTSTATNLSDPVDLKRGYMYPKTYGAHLEINSSQETSGGFVRLALIGENGLGTSASGIRSLDATLTLNEDLLHYIGYEGPNSIMKNGTKITISNNAGLQSTGANILAELNYQVYLTRDSATGITLSDIVLNGGIDTTPCAPTILTGGSESFTYRYECGDRTIQHLLRDVPIEITSIHPNPARDEVTIEFTKQLMTVEVYDAIGKLVAREIAGGRLTFATTNLSAGIYIVRIGGASRSFVVEK